MKKTLFLILFLLNIPTYSAESRLKPSEKGYLQIFQEMQKNTSQTVPEDLKEFLKSDQARDFKDKISSLTVGEKNNLMRFIGSSLNRNWPTKRNFLALIILNGGSINANLSGEYTDFLTFLCQAIDLEDIQGVKFALDNGADTTLKSIQKQVPLLPLIFAIDSYEITQLLIQHGALKPFETDLKAETLLLDMCLKPNSPSKVLELYRQKGLIKNQIDPQQGNSLLIELCRWAFLYKKEQFNEKVQTLIKSDSADTTIKNTFGQTALDVLNAQDQSIQTVQFAKRLITAMNDQQKSKAA